MPYTNDPLADFHAYDRAQTRWLNKLPKCADCRQPIQDDECYEFEEGKLICPRCLKDYRRWTEDFIEE